jgi:hypothetical protein
MASTDREEQQTFENEVRRVARELWPDAQYDGARMVDGKERDGVFETEDCVHLLEATVSRSTSKAQEDIGKLTSHARKLQTKVQHKAVKCWFVTKHEPTAEQRDVALKHRGLVSAVSFSQFQGKLIDAASYLSLRDNYPFGSVRDPATGNQKTAVEYVPLDLIRTDSTELWSVSSIRDKVLDGGCVAVLGDYGAGKSMTLRELHNELKRAHFGNRTTKFPVYVNLRDHFGQPTATEILERHARYLGFAHPSHLVRAWRAGYVMMLIDGFDELTTVGIQGIWKRLQDSRFRAMTAVREFIRDRPEGAGIALAGRAHFFDTDRERRSALGLRAGSVELTLNEFSSEQIRTYLVNCGLSGRVPAWMPSRPLLIGYLAASGLLKDLVIEGDDPRIGPAPARRWDLILDRVCAREAEIEAGIDGPTVRRILERLATMARAGTNGLGPLSVEQLVAAFAEVCGYQPDEKGMVLLQRLPGLGIERADEGTRSFVDNDLADACRAGDVVAFAENPFGSLGNLFRGAESGLGDLGVEIAVGKIQEHGIGAGKLNAVLRKVSESGDLAFLTLDLARATLAAGHSIGVPLQVNDVYIPSLDLYEGMEDCSNLQFHGCYFSSVCFDADLKAEHLPRFAACYVDEIDGRSSARDLPKGVFDEDCTFDRFSEAPETTNAIREMDLPLGARVLLTVLKKLYLQRGSGRKENALHRGLDHHSRRLVPAVLSLLQHEGLAWSYRRAGLEMPIWTPDRAHMARVAKIVTSPHNCKDPLLEKAANLS